MLIEIFTTVLPVHFSDHEALEVFISRKNSEVDAPELINIGRRCINDDNLFNFRMFLNSCDWNALLLNHASDCCFDVFMNIFNLGFESNFPVKMCSIDKNRINTKDKLGWYSDDLKEVKCYLDRIYSYIQWGTKYGYNTEKLKSLLQNERKKYYRMLKQAKCEYNASIIDNAPNK